MGASDHLEDRGRSGFFRGLTAALLEFAEAHFALSKPDATTGKTRLTTLLEIREQTGIVAPELAALPSAPLETEHIWLWFCALSRARGAGFSVSAISWADVAAYFNLMSITPQRWEVASLFALDDAFLASRVNETSGSVGGAKALKGQING